MAWFAIYLFVIADQLREAVDGFRGAFFLGFLSLIIALVILGVIRASINEGSGTSEKKDQVWADILGGAVVKWVRRGIVTLFLVAIAMWTVHTLMPTQKNLAILIGAGVTYEAVTSESGKRIGGKAIELLEQKMDEALKGDSDGKEEGSEEKEATSEKPSKEVHGQAT